MNRERKRCKGSAARGLHPTILSRRTPSFGWLGRDRSLVFRDGHREFSGDADLYPPAAGARPVHLCGREPPVGSGTDACGARYPVSA